MTDNEIYETQDLIDDFMGREHKRWAPGHFNRGYHNEWNYLMPVVEKIENEANAFFGYKFEVDMRGREGIISTRVRPTGKKAVRFHSLEKTKIEAVYKSVVDFIKWHNQQKPLHTHKFKRMRGHVYIVLAKCSICGRIRQGTKQDGYTYWEPNFAKP